MNDLDASCELRWHITVNGEPLCTSPLVAGAMPCGGRDRARLEEHMRELRAEYPKLTIELHDGVCPHRETP